MTDLAASEAWWAVRRPKAKFKGATTPKGGTYGR
jgi:hypothetical protein